MKGLSFNEPMMTAWVEGRKTVTRRLMKPQPDGFHHDGTYESRTRPYHHTMDGYKDIHPPYLPGEMVWIKETWAQAIRNGSDPVLFYKERDAFHLGPGVRWKSPRFMPEWASRSHARIVSVRPERVQEITNEEAVKEGLTPIADCGNVVFHRNKDNQYCTGREEFKELWESLHPGSWDQNPWVWRIELEKLS